jgi:hypothetical protein
MKNKREKITDPQQSKSSTKQSPEDMTNYKKNAM